jgi:nucleoside-diphosphate-sugar epimerase
MAGASRDPPFTFAVDWDRWVPGLVRFANFARDDTLGTREDYVHILITGAAGMVGRKLADRLVVDGGLNGKSVDRLTLVDVVAPKPPAGFSGKVDAYALDVSREDAGRKLVRGCPDVIFHLAAVVSGEAEADFEKGYRINLVPFHYLLEAIRCAGGGYHPKLVFTSSIAVFGAPFPSESRTTSITRR